jgi:hypothetical protein
MRTTYLFTATAALLVASIPAFADGDCQAWNTTTGPVKVCVPPGTDASGYFWTFSALDPSTGASRPGLVLCRMECQEKDDVPSAFIPAWHCTDCGVIDGPVVQTGDDHEDWN